MITEIAGQPITLELVNKMIACAESNIRHERDTKLLQYILTLAIDEKSVFYKILTVPTVQKIVAVHLGLTELVVPNV